MRSLFPSSLQSLRATVSRRGATLVRVERRWRGSSVAMLADMRLDDHSHSGAALHEQVAAALRRALEDSECRRMRMHVVLADELVRYFMVTPPANAGSLRDCRAAAKMRFQALYGEAAAEWRIEADWDARAPFLACALPTNLLRGLQAALAERQIGLAGLAPQFVSAWNRWQRALRGDAWFGVVHDGGMTAGAIQDGRLRAVRALDAAPGTQGATSLENLLAREALLLNLQMPARLLWTADTLDSASAALHCETFGQTSARTADDAPAPARAASLALARKETRA